MNLSFLGDALDHWKGSVFEYLQEEQTLSDFLVDPMATDAAPWDTADSKLYAHLLRMGAKQLVQHHCNLRSERTQYFAESPPSGDVFLDPDIGIDTGHASHGEKYVLPRELFLMMEAQKSRLVIVYQHVRGMETRLRLTSVVDRLRGEGKQFSCTSYESGTVALMFFAYVADRTEAVRECFGRLLGAHAKGRVFHWNC